MEGAVHGQPMDGCGTIRCACWTEHVHVNLLELDGFNYVWKIIC